MKGLKEWMLQLKNKDAWYWLSALGAPIVVALMVFIVFAVKGVFPFGDGDIAYYDMGQATVPVFYHTYDVFHGTKTAFWDWYTGGGISMADAVGGNIISPFNLVFLFVPRDMIMEAMSILLLLKVCFAAWSMSFYMRNTQKKLEWYWHVFAGILYASGGFVLQYYSNIHFLDVAAIFPLIIYFVDKLVKEGKFLGFSITMTVGFIVNVYFMVAVCVYVIIYSAHELKSVEKSIRKSRVMLLGVSAIVALLMSAVIFLPTVMALLQTSRASLGADISSGYIANAIEDEFYVHKKFMLYGTELPLAVMISFLVINRKKLKNIVGYVCEEAVMFVLMVLPIFIEISNQFWHVGGYVHFPMRFGYMVTFTSLAFMGRLLEKMRHADEEVVEKDAFEKEAVETSDKNVIRTDKLMLLTVAMIPVVTIMLFLFTQLFIYNGIKNKSGYSGYWTVFVLMIITYMLAIIARNKKTVGIICGVMVIIQAGLGWYGFVAPSNDYPYEDADVIIKGAQNIGKYIGGEEEDRINRVKDKTVSLNSNYAFIMERASLANWTWGGKSTLRYAVSKLGYNTEYTRIMENGGTLFSDTLFNVRTVIDSRKQDSRLYENAVNVDGFMVSDTKYNYPFGMVVSSDMVNWSAEETKLALEYQSRLSEAVTGAQLFDIYSCKEVSKQAGRDEKSGVYRYVCEVPVDGTGLLYMEPQSTAGDMGEYQKFTINGERYNIAYFAEIINTTYPTEYVNGILECGVYENTTVTVEVESLYPVEDKLYFGVLDVDQFIKSTQNMNKYENSVVAGKGSITIDVNTLNSADFAEAKSLLLPINYDDNLIVTVNGVKVEAGKCIEGALVLIPLEYGDNRVIIHFKQAGLGLGTVLSVIGIILCILLWMFNDKMTGFSILNNCIYGVFKLCELGLMAYLYVFPVFMTLLIWIF